MGSAMLVPLVLVLLLGRNTEAHSRVLVEESQLYCVVTGPCAPCGGDEAKQEHCIKTGYREQLSCTTKQDPNDKYEVVLKQPGQLTTPAGAHMDFSRGCTPHNHRAHGEGGSRLQEKSRLNPHMSVFHFELVMLVVLCLALPVVFWRKMKHRAI